LHLKPGGKTPGDTLDDAANDVRNGVDAAVDDIKKKCRRLRRLRYV